MGLTIFYSGSFRRDQFLHDMIDEALEFANANNWQTFLYDRDFPDDDRINDYDPDHRFGISLMPEKCEALNLYFDAHRRLGYETDLSKIIIETWVQDDNLSGH